MAKELTDLRTLVVAEAETFLDSKQKKDADLKNPDVNWDYMHITYEPTVYKSPTVRAPRPVSHVLFSAKFTNNTPKPQTYQLCTQRSTRSECTVSLQKTFTFGAEVQIKLTPPNPVIEANTGFKTEVTKQKGVEQTFEQELSWSVDNAVSVPPGYETKAELVIKENKFSEDFEEKVVFEGRVVVTYVDRKTKEHVETVSVKVGNVFTSEHGFKKDNLKRPTFTVIGTCKCHYGMQQEVTLTESKIPEPEPVEDKEEEKEE